jgi:hypothetical protein
VGADVASSSGDSHRARLGVDGRHGVRTRRWEFGGFGEGKLALQRCARSHRRVRRLLPLPGLALHSIHGRAWAGEKTR